MNDNSPSIPEAPVHLLSAMAIVALDMVWGFMEAGAAATVVGAILIPFMMLILGGLGFLAVTFTQYFIAKDNWGPAIAKGMVLGIMAAVPFPVVGTIIGVPLLAWAGLSQLTRPTVRDMANVVLPDSRTKRLTRSTADDSRIVDAEFTEYIAPDKQTNR